MTRLLLALLLTGCSVDFAATLSQPECAAVVIQEYRAAPADCGLLWIEGPSGETWLSREGDCDRHMCLEMAPGERAYGMTRTSRGSAPDRVHMRPSDCSERCP